MLLRREMMSRYYNNYKHSMKYMAMFALYLIETLITPS